MSWSPWTAAHGSPPVRRGAPFWICSLPGHFIRQYSLHSPHSVAPSAMCLASSVMRGRGGIALTCMNQPALAPDA